MFRGGLRGMVMNSLSEDNIYGLINQVLILINFIVNIKF